MPYGLLEVTVVEGKKLKETDFFDKADPYVSLSLDRQNKQKTRSIRGATWNEKFTLDVLEGRNELHLEVLDEYVDGDDLIGGASVPLYQVFQNGYAEQWVNITRPSGMPSGEIHLFMNFKKQGPTSGPPGHTPYPVPNGSSYFSPPNSGRNNVREYQMQQEDFIGFGPESGTIPLGYGSGAPPNIKLPHSINLFTTATDGISESSYNMPDTVWVATSQKQGQLQQPTHGAPPYNYKPPSSEQHVKEKEQNSSDDNEIKTAETAAAAAIGSGDDHNHEHEKEDKDNYEKDH